MKAALLSLLWLSLVLHSHAQLQNGFYNGKCGTNNVESTIQKYVAQRFASDQTIVAGLLRLMFHDCFVQGCDASILLDGPQSEKTAIPNKTVFGFDLINQIKAALESMCPGVVSCADIIVAATRDATVLAGGQQFDVQTGRRDGTTSFSWLVNLPPPDISVADSITLFESKGISSFDMVVLMAGHTVGVTHCSVIKNRLYNYQGTGGPDPSMLGWYMWYIQTYVCPKDALWDNIVYLDDYSSLYTVDNSYYKQLVAGKGILPIDAELSSSWQTSWAVNLLANEWGSAFPSMFSQALVKLGQVDVLTGTQGQIRKVCNSVN
ncbi:Peroxidase [Rhynchospora pubera]|uniref:Peroxidase n=1 Tax=Rhynchospora pubera TaxID=906938 RepID=A0AAV8EZD8_9POAL|nr:Peroxidase [Rhynchospora pubera]